jgi:prophage DNA circulation protein
MMAGGPREVATRRPQGSRPELEADELVDLGKVMAGQQAIAKAQEELGGRFDAVEAAWRAVKADHETTQRDVTQLRKSVEDLLHQQKITQRMIRRLGKLGPAVLALVEVIRYVAPHVQALAQHAQQIPNLH